MSYDEKYRSRAVEYKEKGHTFKELKENFGICNYTYYKWKKLKQETGFYAPKNKKRTRTRKINTEELISAIKEKPDAYLRELATKFDCSPSAVHKRLKQLKITHKKNIHLFGKI